MTIFDALLSSIRLWLLSGIAITMLLSQPVPVVNAATREQVAQGYALARPVLRDGASDAAFIEHLKQPGNQGQGDIMATLFFVFKESIAEQNEDKKYWLMKLKMYNDIHSALDDYLQELNDAMKRVNGSGVAAALPIAQAEAALRKFGAKLATANLPAADKHSLESLAAKDRRLFQNARILEQHVRTIARTRPPPPTPSTHDDSPQRSTGPKIPVRQVR